MSSCLRQGTPYPFASEGFGVRDEVAADSAPARGRLWLKVWRQHGMEALRPQITRDVTFTYIQDVTQSNPTIIRMEWAINPRWSAIAARDVSGEFNVDLFYKRRFR